jgi:hypothetical protein
VLRVFTPSQGGTYWHPYDYIQSGSTFSTWNVFDELAGNAKVEGTATSKTYTDVSGATLKLENSGVMGNNTKAFDMSTKDVKEVAGFELTLAGAESAILGSYNFVATGADCGKILMHFSGFKGVNQHHNYNDNNAGRTYRYVIGDYKKVGDAYMISFEQQEYGKFVFTMDAFAGVKDTLAGDYIDLSGETVSINLADISELSATSITEGTFKVGQVVYSYAINEGRTVLNARISGKDVVLFN